MTNADERTFVMIKPDGIERQLTNVVFERFSVYGRRIKEVHIPEMPMALLDAHYAPAFKKHGHRIPLREFTRASFEGKPFVIAAYEGENVIALIKDALGATDPAKAADWTIRGEYGNDSLDVANAFGRCVRNIAHASDTDIDERERSSAYRELYEVWNEILGLEKPV